MSLACALSPVLISPRAKNGLGKPSRASLVSPSYTPDLSPLPAAGAKAEVQAEVPGTPAKAAAEAQRKDVLPIVVLMLTFLRFCSSYALSRAELGEIQWVIVFSACELRVNFICALFLSLRQIH